MSKLALIRAVALPAALLFAACSTAPEFNLLLITLDTTRADRLGCYGYRLGHTPTLDSLAESGVLFENAFTPAPVTLPAHASLLTGLYPPVHGVRDNGIYRLEDEAVTLAELLGRAGMNTAAAISAYVLASRFGLAQGFAHYDERLKEAPGQKAAFYVERSAEEVTNAALQWLEGRDRRKPFFLWVHYFDPHSPYAPPAPFDSLCPGRPYDGEIAYMDSQLCRLLSALRQGGQYGRTLVAVAGDHGEALGEHGEPTHGIFLYNSTVRVPLIVKFPGGEHAGGRVDANVSLVDVFPTVLERAGLSIPAGIQGRSLLPLLPGARRAVPGASRTIYLETLMPEQTFGWHRLEGMVHDNLKYIAAPLPELYDITADPGESRNLVEHDAEAARRSASRLANLQRELARLARPLSGRVTLDGESARRLRALGYLSGAEAAVSGESLPDPKLMVRSLGRFMDGVMAEAGGEYEAALAAFDSVLAGDPDNLYAIRYKGFVLMEQGSVRRAIAQFTRAVELQPGGAANFMLALAWYRLDSLAAARTWLERTVEVQPGHARAHALLADILLESGEDKQAVAHMLTARKLAPQDKEVLNDLGRLLLGRGDPAGAAECFEQALAVDPHYPLALYNLGIALYQTGEYGKAEEALALVAAKYPGDEKVQNNLGVVRAARGDPDGAQRAYRAALNADSTFAPAWNNLGNILAAHGPTDRAKICYKTAIAYDSNYAQAWFNLGRLLLNSSNDEPGKAQAAKNLRRALKLAPSAPWAESARKMLARAGGE